MIIVSRIINNYNYDRKNLDTLYVIIDITIDDSRE